MKLTLGDKIKELRKRDGRKQEDLANALGVTNQAVSRWEANGGYPDMEMIPAIANYFGITIDELFGYENDREKKIDKLVSKINEMNFMNNGVNINIDECISLAREALIEFPVNKKLMLCLASVLFNAGYVRYGEYHLTDSEGYSIYDAERHRTYAEWKEAIAIYEKLMPMLEPSEARNRAVEELTQLYLNLGEHEKALEIVETMPTIYGSREFLRINAVSGKKQAEACGEALLRTVRACSMLIIWTVLAYEQNMSISDKAKSIKSAIQIFDIICTDGNYGIHNSHIARVYTLLSVYLWLDNKKDEAFEALDKSLLHFREFEKSCEEKNLSYTAPLIRLVNIEPIQAKANDSNHPHTSALSLVEDWPSWCVPEACLVKEEIQSDPRWNEWVEKCKA